ncbi:signal peptidase I [Luethyella okanaganae]|uniref:Signal peptidase I n=1 Tax=Luethyella okanaganae TaxID=69372 RepID=A0ABW1VCT9_9MICO
MTIGLPAEPGTRREAVSRPRFSLLRMLRSGILWLAAALGIASIVLFAICMIFQLRPQIVVSGSMEPTIPVGSMILATEVSAAEIAPGDVVTVDRPGGRGLVSHRVVSIESQNGGYSIVLKGDANETADPEPYLVSTVGKLVVSLPVVGYVAAALKTPIGIGSVVALLILVFVLGFVGRSGAGSSRRGRTAN